MFPKRLKTLRTQAKRTQAEMAEYLKINRSTYGEYERGVITPPIDKIKLIAEFFEVTVAYLVGESQVRMFEIKEDDKDVLNYLQIIMEYLENESSDLKFDGKSLNEHNREFLISQIQSSIKTAYKLNS